MDQTLRDFIAGLGDVGATDAVVALGDSGPVAWSYAELHRRAAGLANGLAGRGIGRGDRVALCAGHGPDWIVAALATIAAGATLVPVDPQCDAASLTHIVEDSGADLWLVSSRVERRLQDRAAHGLGVYVLDAPAGAANSWERLKTMAELPAAAPAPGDIAVMFYTSGTTGMPKGVPLTHRNLMFQVETLRSFDLIGEGERVLLALPLHHVYPFSIGLLGVFAFKGTVVIARALTGPEIARAMRDGAVGTVLSVPRFFEVLLSGLLARVRDRSRLLHAGLRALLAVNVRTRRWFGIRIGRWVLDRLGRRIGAPLRMMVSGGAALDETLAATMDALGWRVATGYGLTETSPLIALLPPGDLSFDTVGLPVRGMELRIAPAMQGQADNRPADADDGRRDERAIGEIQVRGPGVFAGYHNLAEKTAAAFTDDGWFRTEDLGFLDGDGYLHIFGRHTTLIVTAAGENIQPETLETAYAADRAIREIGVFQHDGLLCAVVVPDHKALRRDDGTNEEAAVRDAMLAVARRLPSHHRVSRYVIGGDALARTRLGKIRRADLARRYEEIESGRGAAVRRPTGPMPLAEMSDEDRALIDEPAARAVWELLTERYPQRPIGPDASLANDLGIDSLEWINVTLDIRHRAGVEITEQATARIETVRDLLNEAVAAEQESRDEDTDALFDDPHRFVGADQKRWLLPLRPFEAVCARILYGLNKAVMRWYFRLEVVGGETLRRDGCVIWTPNHASVLDPFVVAAALDFPRLRDTYWAGWTGMAFANPLFRFVSRIAQVLPIEQERAAFSSLALSLIVLGERKNLIWFPEGARSRDGRIHRFRTGIGIVMKHRPVEAVPMFIDGTFEAMPIGRRLPRPVPLRLVVGKPLAIGELEKSGQGATRDERIADGLERAVRALRDAAG